jgi:SAM-dependent methyltransferase
MSASVEPKPAQWSAADGAAFADEGVAAAYPNRPPLSQQAIDTLIELAELVAGEPRVVLDAGCGTGDLARRVAPRVARVDALDPRRWPNAYAP